MRWVAATKWIPGRWWPLVILSASLLMVVSPALASPGKMGILDWDSHAAYRFITWMSLKQYGEFPWWHPYFCGGFPAWGQAEGVSNLVSPFAPLYWALPFIWAFKLEAIGAM